MSVCFIPFTSSVLGVPRATGHDATGAAEMVLWVYVADELDRVTMGTLRNLTPPAVFILALPLILVSPYLAMTAWIVIYVILVILVRAENAAAKGHSGPLARTLDVDGWKRAAMRGTATRVHARLRCGDDGRRGTRAARRGARWSCRLVRLGSVPGRTAVGHGARGLLRRWRRLAITFPHDQARSRAYRWGEDGMLGICDDHASPVLWRWRCGMARPDRQGTPLRTGQQRGQSRRGRQGVLLLSRRHADALLSESAVQVSAARHFPTKRSSSKTARGVACNPNTSCVDTGIFDQQRYWDVVVEYAKAAPHDILMRIEAVNRGPEPATLHLLPTLWFRNTWSWGNRSGRRAATAARSAGPRLVEARHGQLGTYWLAADDGAELLFTDNDTNARRLWNATDASHFVKDGINDHIVSGQSTLNTAQSGTRLSVHWMRTVDPGEATVVRLRLSDRLAPDAFSDFDAVVSARRQDADDYHRSLLPEHTPDDDRAVYRQAVAGLMWSKQFYLTTSNIGCGAMRRVRRRHRNAGPAATTCGCNCVPPMSFPCPTRGSIRGLRRGTSPFSAFRGRSSTLRFAKQQLLLLLREWYMDPSGQVPAYEWVFGDVNPPVQAWAAWRVYKIDRRLNGAGDRIF